MEWISVKDKFPNENHKSFLVTDGFFVDKGYWDTNEFIGVQDDFLNEITHWMEFPTPPDIIRNSYFMKSEHFEKIITVNVKSYETVRHCVDKLLYFMYKENANTNVEYFRLRLKDSKKSPFSKDLLLEWVCLKSDVTRN